MKRQQVLPEAVLNLLDLHSVYACWSITDRCWEIRSAKTGVIVGNNVGDYAPLAIWMAAVKRVETGKGESL